MANELTYHSAANTGDTLYVHLENTVGQVWNGSTFEAPVSANWANYDIAMTEQGTSTGIFRASMPAASAGAYCFVVRKQAGASPAVTDIVLGSSQVFGWNGSVITDDLLAKSAGTIVSGTVDTAVNGHTPSTVEFQADDITETRVDHFKGRIVIFTSGNLKREATDITAYQAIGGIGQFTVTALTEAPANNDTFVIV